MSVRLTHIVDEATHEDGARLLSLLLHLGAGLALAMHRGLTPHVRWLAVSWLLASPLSLVLAAVPLTEMLTTLLLIIGLVSLERYLEHGRSPLLLLSAAAYLGATMVRYEAWALLPVFSAFALSRKPRRYFVLVDRALAFLPWFFPLVWTVLLWALQGEPFTFLSGVSEDHFGAGDLLGSLMTPLGAVTAVQVLIAATVIGIGASGLARGRRILHGLVWEAHWLAAAAFVVLILARGDVPSQFPIRMVYPLVLLAAVPLARLVAERVTGSRLRLAIGAGVGAALIGLGTFLARGLPPGVEDEHLRAAEHLGRMVAEGELGPDGHALIERWLPESAAVLVFSNETDRVHIDAVGGDCPARLLGPSPLMCPIEPWSADVRVVLTRGESGPFDLEELGWRLERRFGDWALFRKPPGATPLGTNYEPP